MTALTCKMCPEWNRWTPPRRSGLRGQHCPAGPTAGPGLLAAPSPSRLLSAAAEQPSSPQHAPSSHGVGIKDLQDPRKPVGPPQPWDILSDPPPPPGNLITTSSHSGLLVMLPVAPRGPTPGPLPCCCLPCNTLQMSARLAGLCPNGTCARRPHLRPPCQGAVPSIRPLTLLHFPGWWRSLLGVSPTHWPSAYCLALSLR